MKLATAPTNVLCVYFFRTHSFVYKREGEKRGCNLWLSSRAANKRSAYLAGIKLKVVC